MRINKFIASTGICSRRKAEEYINQGRVYINGQKAELHSIVDETKDTVSLDNKPISIKDEKVYILLNKPVGIISTTEKKVKNNIIDYVNYPIRIFPIGRLDQDSHGLIVLTNDGDVVNKALRSENNHRKEYVVTVNRDIDDFFIEAMQNGIKIYNPVHDEMVITKKCEVIKLSHNKFKITLSQGYNRQIRRMCKALGYSVNDLCRISFMNLKDPSLKPGMWRLLSDNEKGDFLNALK